MTPAPLSLNRGFSSSDPVPIPPQCAGSEGYSLELTGTVFEAVDLGNTQVVLFYCY
jgi:hypothetical protein